jgi:hypothetical protein
MHVKARCEVYPVRRDEKRHGEDVKRLPVPDTKVRTPPPRKKG